MPEEWSSGKDRFLLLQAQARFKSLPFDMVLSKIRRAAKDQDISFDPEVTEGQSGSIHTNGKIDSSWVSAEYHWSIKPDEGEFLVTETIDLSRLWLLPYISLSIGVALTLWFLFMIDSAGAPLLLMMAFGFAIFGFSGVAFSSIPENAIESVIKNLDQPGVTLSKHAHAHQYLLLINVVILLGGIISYYLVGPVLVSIFALASLGFIVVTWFGHGRLTNISVSADYMQDIPTPTAEYIVLMIGALLPASSLIAGSMMGIEISTTATAIAVPASLVILPIIPYLVSREKILAIQMFRHGGRRYISNRKTHAISLGVSVALSYISAATAIWVFQQSEQLSFGTRALVVLPLSYFWIGALIQSIGLYLQIKKINEDTRPADFPAANTVDAEVLVSTSGIGPSAYSTGFDTRIVIPETVVELLNTDELEAVLSHEDAHASVYPDSFLSFLGPLAGLLMLTGQNVIYAFLDFREREFRADRYAAEQAGEENLASALRTLEEESLSSDTGRIQNGAAFTPFTSFSPADDDVRGFIAERFSLFYGGFALSEAHPSTEERINQLNFEDD